MDSYVTQTMINKLINLLAPMSFFFSFHMLSLDLCLSTYQVLINGLQHFVALNVKPKLQMVETFIKVSNEGHGNTFPLYCLQIQMNFATHGRISWVLLPDLFYKLGDLTCLKLPLYVIYMFITNTRLGLINQAYYLPETEYVHWARAHPVRISTYHSIVTHLIARRF